MNFKLPVTIKALLFSFGTLGLLVVSGSAEPAPAESFEVVEISEVGDLSAVVFEGGQNLGVRRGMKFIVQRDLESVAELIVVEVDGQSSVALITDLDEGRAIRNGDKVFLKTIQFASSWK